MEELKEALRNLEDWQLLELIREVVAEKVKEVDYVEVTGDKLALSDAAKLLFLNRVLNY